jgi:beta-lactam-binding protein with PASTA domain
MKYDLDKIFKMPIRVHLLAMGVLLCIIIYIVLKSIDTYTNHNQAVYVPDVRGLQIEDAAPFFKQNMLRYAVVDSIFANDVTPGAIVELRPEAKSKVKRNRIVDLTINAKSEETVPVPDIADISFRQAYALLSARGFTDIEYKYVTGEYRDLTVGLEYEGRSIGTGVRVPLTAKLILVISDGYVIPPDSNAIIKKEDERLQTVEEEDSWF